MYFSHLSTGCYRSRWSSHCLTHNTGYLWKWMSSTLHMNRLTSWSRKWVNICGLFEVQGGSAMVGFLLYCWFFSIGFLAHFCLFYVCLPDELNQQGFKHKEEVAFIQKSVSTLDREKDALQDEVDQKAEKLVVLQEELAKKVTIANSQSQKLSSINVRPHQDYKLLFRGCKLNCH